MTTRYSWPLQPHFLSLAPTRHILCQIPDQLLLGFSPCWADSCSASFSHSNAIFSHSALISGERASMACAQHSSAFRRHSSGEIS